MHSTVPTLDISLFTPKVMPITQMLNALIESQQINSNPDIFYFVLHIMNENIFMMLYETKLVPQLIFSRVVLIMAAALLSKEENTDLIFAGQILSEFLNNAVFISLYMVGLISHASFFM